MKILMTTMSLDIGGAETHITELSKALHAMEHEVTVASCGGVYVDELERAGVKHITLPLNTKSLSSVCKSYKGLKKLIKEEKFDIVHAHARIPAFICGLLAKRLKFCFVTTAHGTFDVNFLWKHISNWGEKTLSVSYDIKDYLIKNYEVPSDNITLTINGIDTERFSDNIPYDDIVSEFNIKESAHRVLYVSRIDAAAAHVGFQLVRSAPHLYEHYPDLQIVMVGHGDVFAKLHREAERVNRSIGERVIIMTGARTDINKFCAWGDVFVGVSRAALEAMSAKCLPVLSGSQGSIGIFTPEKLRVALDTNFTARGCGLSDENILYENIRKVFQCDEEKKAALRDYMRSVVKEHYSVKRMAEDAQRVYLSLLPHKSYKRGEYLLGGYYGFGNTGDDSLLQVVISQIKQSDPNAKITVLARNPKKVARVSHTRCINRFNIPKVFLELRNAKVLVYGGGSLLQSATSSRSLAFYCFVLEMAHKMGVKTMLYANGIGPFRSKRDERRAKAALDNIDCITLRDAASAKTMRHIGVKNENVYCASDAAFANITCDAGWCAHILSRAGLPEDKKYFAVSVRKWKKMNGAFLDNITEACRRISNKYDLVPLFISMQEKRDRALCNTLAGRTGGICIGNLSPREVHAVIAGAEAVIGMRLHLLIYASSCAVPVIGISYDPKVDALFEELESDALMSVSDTRADTLCEMFDGAMNDGCEKRKQKAKELTEKSLISIEKLKELMEK